MTPYEQYLEAREPGCLALEKALGQVMPSIDLSDEREFELMMREMYLRADDDIYGKLQEVMKNPPLDAWAIEVRMVPKWGQMSTSTQGFTRRRLADAVGTTPFVEAYRKVCSPVPVDHIRVVVVFPAKNWFYIQDRPIRWRAPRDENNQIIVSDLQRVVAAAKPPEEPVDVMPEGSLPGIQMPKADEVLPERSRIEATDPTPEPPPETAKQLEDLYAEALKTNPDQDRIVVVGVQINGKTVGTVYLSAKVDQETALAAAQQEPNIKRLLEDKTIKEVIHKPWLLNLIVQ